MTSWAKELDEAAEMATRSGYWHMVLFFLLCGLAAIPTSFLVFSQVFTNGTPEHWCAPPPELESLLLPDEFLRSLTVPKEQGIYESCQAYSIDPTALYAALDEYVDERSELIREGGTLRIVKVRQLVPAVGEAEREQQILKVEKAILSLRSNESEGCAHGWKFSNEHYSSTLVTEYSLVCDNAWIPTTGTALFWVGSIFGNLIFGSISDKYGRRPTILLMILLEVPLSIVSSFPSTYWSYTGIRIVSGLFFPTMYQQPFVLALELMPPKKRPHTGIFVGMLFASGMCLLALVAFAIRDWFYLSLATSLPFVFLFGYYWLIPESPRWLVGRGRIAKAEKVFRDMAKKNGIDLPRGFLMELHKRAKDEETEITLLTDGNGHIMNFPETLEKNGYDLKINNMLTFKPDFAKITISEDANKVDNLERMLALEVADIVNNKKFKKDKKASNDELNEYSSNVEPLLNHDLTQKSTQIDPLKKSPNDTLRKKSIQIVSKIFITGDDKEDELENKRMDDENSEGDCEASLFDIFRYPNLRKKFFLLTFNMAAIGVVYNSFSYNTPNLGVDDYLAFFIGGAVEIPSYFLAWRCMDKYGRRWVLCIFMNIGGLLCISCMFVPETSPWITVFLSMVGRLLIAASFAVFYVQIGELLPTVLRAQAMGAATFISGIALLASPYIAYLAIYGRALPFIVMGILSVLPGVLSMFLPESLNQTLPQTLEDGEMFGRNFKLLSCVEKPEKSISSDDIDR